MKLALSLLSEDSQKDCFCLKNLYDIDIASICEFESQMRLWSKQREDFMPTALQKFSFYLYGRIHVLLDTGKEILSLLDRGFSSYPINVEMLIKADALSWLWTLGAYEVVRTMCEKKEAFSNSAQNELEDLKTNLAAIRMPSAKMEARGKKLVINSNRSPCGWDENSKDLLLGDPNNRKSARYIINKFEKAISSIKETDI